MRARVRNFFSHISHILHVCTLGVVLLIALVRRTVIAHSAQRLADQMSHQFAYKNLGWRPAQMF